MYIWTYRFFTKMAWGFPWLLGATTMEYGLFAIEFKDSSHRRVDRVTVAAWDYLDACDFGWSHMPEGADDFQVTELPFPPDPTVEPEGTGPLLARWLPKSVAALKANTTELQRMLDQQQKMLMCVAPGVPQEKTAA